MRDFNKIREVWNSLSNVSNNLKNIERDYTKRISESEHSFKIKKNLLKNLD